MLDVVLDRAGIVDSKVLQTCVNKADLLVLVFAR
jgi:hypothetical protein